MKGNGIKRVINWDLKFVKCIIFIKIYFINLSKGSIIIKLNY